MKFLFKPFVTVIICVFSFSLSIAGCTNIIPPDEIEIDYSIGDWDDEERYETSPDSVSDMTHADSVRLEYFDY